MRKILKNKRESLSWKLRIQHLETLKMDFFLHQIYNLLLFLTS